MISEALSRLYQGYKESVRPVEKKERKSDGKNRLKRNGFNAYYVLPVKGLSRKEAEAKRAEAYKEHLRRKSSMEFKKNCRQAMSMEESRSERNAWKVRSYLANKERQ